MSPLIPVILCGGVGSRLWPVSRKAYPKPFIKLEDGESLLQKAYKRASALKDVSEILTVTNKELHYNMLEEYSIVSQSTENAEKININFVLEPFGKNTAAAVAAACTKLLETHQKDVVVLILAADHLIENQIEFSHAVEKASALAQNGKIVTFGIYPTRPETGYGYIEYFDNEVVKFVEKPSEDKATEFLSSGKHLWNSGMLCFSAKKMLEELNKYCPDILNKTQDCLRKSLKGENSFSQDSITLDSATFAEVPSESIDYAVLENTDSLAVVPCEIDWSDIGCWKSLGDLTIADDNSNRFYGNVVSDGSSNCSVRSENNSTIGLVGVNNLIVVNTPDAVLVANKDKTQEVKNIYQTLLNKKHETHEFHTTVHRPWGTYTVLEESRFFKVKKIEVKKEAKLSLQMHNFRDEHWVVVKGKALVTNGDKTSTLEANESVFIPAKNKHCLENIGDETLAVIEVQTGSYLGEDDIIRFQDIYGRA